jgi:hypothetical protein
VSKFEAQFVEEMNKFQESILSLSQSSPLPLNAFEKDVRQHVENREKMWNYSEDFKSEAATHKQRSVFLISRKPDLERQLGEAKRLVAIHTKSQSAENGILSSQTLDADSERTRRQLGADAIMIPRHIDILEGQVKLMEAARQDGGRTMYAESSGKGALLEAVKNVSDLSNVVNSASARCHNKVGEMSHKVPRSWDSSAWKSPEPKGRRSRSRISPHPGVEKSAKAIMPASKAVIEAHSSGSHRWKRIEQQFRMKATVPPKQTQIDLPAPVLALKREKPSGKPHVSKTDQSSLLLSPQQIEKSTGRRSSGASIAADLFSVPNSSLSTRPEWDAGFTTDQMKVRNLSFNLPEHLKEVNSSDAARESLAQYGTTPEKLAKVMDAKYRGEVAAKNPAEAAFAKQPSTPKRTSTSSSAGFPPLPTKAPTPFSQKSSIDASVPTPSAPPKSSAYPPLAKVAPKPFGSSSEPPAKNQRTPDKVASSALGGMKSLGDSLFPSVAPASGASVFGGTPSVAPALPSTSSGPDYHAVLTKFYEKHNPDKVKDVTKHLDRYKGNEHAMFGKLAQKYKVANPLDAIGSTPAAAPTTPFDAQAANAAPAPAVPSSTTPFGAKTANSTVGTTTPGMPFGAKASPFESGLSAPAPSPFGSTAQSTASFGGGAPAAAPSPFGNVPSPFGASTTSSSQAPRASAFGNAMSADTSFGQPSNAPAPTPFGAAPAPVPFGAAAPAPFGGSAPAPSPFGGSAPAPSPFGGSAPAPSPFGGAPAPSPFGAAAPAPFGGQAPVAPTSFGGKSPRELLVAFYQQYNAAKLGDVDKVLQKYQGHEEKLFRNLAHKYKLDPAVFGLGPAPAQAPAPSSGGGGFGGGFGQASPLGGGSVFGGGAPGPAPAFGTPSGFGGNSTFSGGGFGSPPAAAPGGFGGGASAPGFGSTSAFGGSPQPGGFGSLAQQGGGGFGAPAQGGFGGPTPFGAPSGGGFSGGGGGFGAPRR